MLSPRLNMIKKAIVPGESIADIGTDHALLLQDLALEGQEEKTLIGTDLNSEPLKKAQEHLKEKGLENRVQLRQGDGLNPLAPAEVQGVVIAGLGGLEIKRIFEESKEKAKTFETFYLLPHQQAAQLREYIFDNGFTLFAEDLAKEKDHFYFLLIGKPGQEKREWTQTELELGPLLLEKKHPMLPPFIKKRMKDFQRILKKIEKTGDSPCQQMLVLEQKIEEYGEVLEWLLK